MSVSHQKINQLTEKLHELKNRKAENIDMTIVSDMKNKLKKDYNYWKYHKKTAHQLHIEAQKRREDLDL